MQACSFKRSGVYSDHRVVKTKTNLSYREGAVPYRAVNTFLLCYINQPVNIV